MAVVLLIVLFVVIFSSQPSSAGGSRKRVRRSIEEYKRSFDCLEACLTSPALEEQLKYRLTNGGPPDEELMQEIADAKKELGINFLTLNEKMDILLANRGRVRKWAFNFGYDVEYRECTKKHEKTNYNMMVRQLAIMKLMQKRMSKYNNTKLMVHIAQLEDYYFWVGTPCGAHFASKFLHLHKNVEDVTVEMMKGAIPYFYNGHEFDG